MAGIYAWQTMTPFINGIKTAPFMLRNMFFGQENPRASETILVDLETGGRKLAPFVSNTAPGTIVNQGAVETRSVTPPRIRLKESLNAADLLGVRGPGQISYIQGVQDINQAKARLIANKQRLLRNSIDTTIEWMCANILSTGAFSYSDENVSFSIDYQMPSDCKVTLAAADLWTADGITFDNVRDNIQSWYDIIAKHTGQGNVVAICGRTAASALLARVGDSKWFDSSRINAGQMSWDVANAYMGTAGGIQFYRYYVADVQTMDGTAASMIPDNMVILVNTSTRLSLEFGLIQEVKDNVSIQAAYYSKSWEVEDPSVRWVLAESRPLPVVWRPGSCLAATVC